MQSAEGTHMLALPVSKHMETFCGGLPMPMIP